MFRLPANRASFRPYARTLAKHFDPEIIWDEESNTKPNDLVAISLDYHPGRLFEWVEFRV
jgi:hypothetical protein